MIYLTWYYNMIDYKNSSEIMTLILLIILIKMQSKFNVVKCRINYTIFYHNTIN